MIYYIYIFLLFYKSFEIKVLIIFYNFNNLVFLFYISYPSDNVKTRSVNLIMREQPLKITLPYRNYYSHFAYFREKLDYIYRSDNDVIVKKQIKCNFRGID